MFNDMISSGKFLEFIAIQQVGKRLPLTIEADFPIAVHPSEFILSLKWCPPFITT